MKALLMFLLSVLVVCFPLVMIALYIAFGDGWEDDDG